MVGKLNIDKGTDYAFDIRRAREVAENASSGGGTNPAPPPPPPIVDGPNTSNYGEPYWLQRDDMGDWYIWWDVDADPEPDIKQPLAMFLSNASVDLQYRADVKTRAEALGWAN